MKIIYLKRVAYCALILLGALGFWDLVDSIKHVDNREPITDFTFVIGLMALGGFGLKSVEVGYKGGAPSIIGGLFVLLGVLSIAQQLDEYYYPEPEQTLIGFIAGIILLGMGVVLVRSGHKTHKVMKQLESDETKTDIET